MVNIHSPNLSTRAPATPLVPTRRLRDLAWAAIWSLVLAAVGVTLGFAIVAWIEAILSPPA